MRRMLREFLQAAFPDKPIHEAADGRSTLALRREHRPPGVLMDTGLPNANGIKLNARIKTMLPDTAVIIVSSHAGSAYIDWAKAAGAFAYIAKEAVHDKLLQTVATALGLTRQGNK